MASSKKAKKTNASTRREFQVDEKKLTADLQRILQFPPVPMKKPAK
jgi:hypothetical protein